MIKENFNVNIETEGRSQYITHPKTLKMQSKCPIID